MRCVTQTGGAGRRILALWLSRVSKRIVYEIEDPVHELGTKEQDISMNGKDGKANHAKISHMRYVGKCNKGEAMSVYGHDPVS